MAGDDGDRKFQAPDYVVFGLMLVVSAGIGFFMHGKIKRIENKILTSSYWEVEVYQ
jgi:hypothetical protein